jgi:hypothetical protein
MLLLENMNFLKCLTGVISNLSYFQSDSNVIIDYAVGCA